MTADEEIIEDTIKLIFRYGGIDGGHHKQWLLDQALRILTGNEDEYKRRVAEACAGEDGPQTYDWEEGIAP